MDLLPASVRSARPPSSMKTCPIKLPRPSRANQCRSKFSFFSQCHSVSPTTSWHLTRHATFFTSLLKLFLCCWSLSVAVKMRFSVKGNHCCSPRLLMFVPFEATKGSRRVHSGVVVPLQSVAEQSGFTKYAAKTPVNSL